MAGTTFRAKSLGGRRWLRHCRESMLGLLGVSPLSPATRAASVHCPLAHNLTPSMIQARARTVATVTTTTVKLPYFAFSERSQVGLGACSVRGGRSVS